MISFAADLGRSGPIFAAYAQIGPAIFSTLLPHSKTPPLLWPKRKQKERFLLGIFVILHNVPHKAPGQQMAAFHIAAHHQHCVAADILYYLYTMYLNIQCGVITPIHRIGDGAHAAGIADHGGVGCGVAQGLHCCGAAALAQSTDHAVAGHQQKSPSQKNLREAFALYNACGQMPYRKMYFIMNSTVSTYIMGLIFFSLALPVTRLMMVQEIMPMAMPSEML